MTTLNIEGRRVTVDDGFKDLTPEEQQRTVEEIAQQMGIAQAVEPMGQLNAGIAGVMDAVTLRGPHNRLQEALGREPVRGFGEAAQAAGASVSTDAPQGVVENFMRGAGEAAAIAPLAGIGAGALGGMSGTAGAVGRNIFGSVNTTRAFGAEALAGGLARGAHEAAEPLGPVAQSVASVAAPLSIPAAGAAIRGAVGAAERTPIAGMAVRAGRDMARMIAPASEAGARQGARQRLEELVGGRERASELSDAINPADPLGRTGAQQTGDPNLLGLEATAQRENPLLRVELEDRASETRQIGREALAGFGGNREQAEQYFRARVSQFKDNMQAGVDRALAGSPKASDRTESEMSTSMVGKIKAQLEDWKLQERFLWDSVPLDVQSGFANAQSVAQSWQQRLGRAGASDMPPIARQLLLDDGGYEGPQSAQELHNLYSALRETARNSRAGLQTRDKLALVADDIADALLKDLDEIPAVSQPLNDARALSAVLHDTFDKGAVGRILKRTPAGDEGIQPETALARTVGRGGAQASADDASIVKAAPDAAQDVSDYLAERFLSRFTNASGEFNTKTARTWLRDNAELVAQYPRLRSEMLTALGNRQNAEAFAVRQTARMKVDQSRIAQFGNDSEKAVASIFNASNPAKEARRIVQTAKRDPSGAAMEGVKGAFVDFMLGRVASVDGLSGQQLDALLKDPKMVAGLRQVFSNREYSDLKRLAKEMAKVDGPKADVGAVLDSPANKMIEFIVRYVAVQKTSAAGSNAGAQLQIANMTSNRAKEILGRLTNDRARTILVDAVRDPELMKALMSPAPQSKFVQSKIAPYLIGAAAGAEE